MFMYKKDSLLPVTDLETPKPAAKILNHHELATPLLPPHRFHETKLCFKQKNEDMNSSRVHQNQLTGYCLTQYYVKTVSFLPDSDLQTPKSTAKFSVPISTSRNMT